METNNTPEQMPSGLDVAAYLVSVASLLGSIFSATLLVPARHGLYGGTAALVFIVIFFQVMGFLLAVGVPALIQVRDGDFACRTAQLSWYYLLSPGWLPRVLL